MCKLDLSGALRAILICAGIGYAVTLGLALAAAWTLVHLALSLAGIIP